MPDEDTKLIEARKKVEEFVKKRNWTQFHSPKNLSMSIAIESGELMELFQWENDNQIQLSLQNKQFRERVEEELADVIIYSLSFANSLDIDISEIIKKKIEKNASKYPVDRSFGNSTKYTEFE